MQLLIIMYPRTLNLKKLLKQKSFFLFGPRGTGKTTLIKNTLSGVRIIDLLDIKTYRDYLRNPSLLPETNPGPLVVIDEVQKLPELLDEVHRMIENSKAVFLLTGSSARKLKRGGANLLAGRAWRADLFPLTSHEIGDFDLLTYLNRGGLPAIYPSRDYVEELHAYTGLYLKEEIQNESITRKIANFSEFLDLMALSCGEEISYQSLAGDCGVSPNSIKNYMEILEDTLIAFQLKSFSKTRKRKAISRSKLYFFDIGVTNSLANRGKILPDSELFGKALEHFIILEARAYLSYRRKKIPMTYWRSTSNFEVDLILGNQWAIEIKGSKHVHDKHLKGLRALKEEGMVKHYAAVSCDSEERVLEDGIRVFPWKLFLERLWKDEIV